MKICVCDQTDDRSIDFKTSACDLLVIYRDIVYCDMMEGLQKWDPKVLYWELGMISGKTRSPPCLSRVPEDMNQTGLDWTLRRIKGSDDQAATRIRFLATESLRRAAKSLLRLTTGMALMQAEDFWKRLGVKLGLTLTPSLTLTQTQTLTLPTTEYVFWQLRACGGRPKASCAWPLAWHWCRLRTFEKGLGLNWA